MDWLISLMNLRVFPHFTDNFQYSYWEYHASTKNAFPISRWWPTLIFFSIYRYTFDNIPISWKVLITRWSYYVGSWYLVFFCEFFYTDTRIIMGRHDVWLWTWRLRVRFPPGGMIYFHSPALVARYSATFHSLVTDS